MLTSLTNPSQPLLISLASLQFPLASDAGAAAGGVMALGMMCCFGVFGLAIFGFWIWMLVDVCTREFDDNDKVVWILVVALLQGLGALIYFFFGRSKGRKR